MGSAKNAQIMGEEVVNYLHLPPNLTETHKQRLSFYAAKMFLHGMSEEDVRDVIGDVVWDAFSAAADGPEPTNLPSPPSGPAYTIVGDSPDAIGGIVTKMLKEGWKLHGTPFIIEETVRCANDFYGTVDIPVVSAYQAMIREF